MTNEDFEKLKKKVEKDPGSKLVVPLADEYKKRGLPDDAVEVLLKTMERLPDYPAARVALGKIYIDKGMLAEAREEFEKVVKLTPDNLLAHKRLAEIYKKQGEDDRAVEQCVIVLGLNPDDEEAQKALQELRPEMSDTAPEEGEAEKTPVYEINEEVDGADLGVEIPEKLLPAGEPVSPELEEYRKTVEKHIEGSAAKEPQEEQDAGRGEDDTIVISMPTATMADIFISQDLYDKAMNIYKEILSSDPGNEQIMQRHKELQMLIKIKEERDRG